MKEKFAQIRLPNGDTHSSVGWAQQQIQPAASYPGVFEIRATPKGGTTNHRYRPDWWQYLINVNTHMGTMEGFYEALQNWSGVINAAANPQVQAGEYFPVHPKPDEMPVWEGVASIDNYVKLLELKSSSYRIEIFDYLKAPPAVAEVNPETHPWLFDEFHSINSAGHVDYAPKGKRFFFPRLAQKGIGWLPVEVLKVDVNPLPYLKEVKMSDSPTYTPKPVSSSPILQGKGMYLWIISRVEGGDPNAIAELARQAGMSHVLIKVADGSGLYNIDKNTNKDNVPALVSALRARGIQPWGWQYIYGRNAKTEAQAAIQRVRQFDLDGFVVNAEVEFKASGMEPVARQYMQLLRAALPNTPIAFSSFRYPSLHRPLPFETFLEYSDINMPQVYWQLSYNPAQQLLKCLREHQALRVWRPLLPTGTAYPQGSWAPTAAQLNEFMQTSKSNDLLGVNYWEWYYARKAPALWDAIKDFAWKTSGPPKPVDIGLRFVEALNSRDPVKVTSLYGNAGVHVNAQSTVQGREGILRWYNSLLRDRLPGANFQVTGASQDGNLRIITWTATSENGQVLDGKDSLGVQNDQIAYHYTYFTVQA